MKLRWAGVLLFSTVVSTYFAVSVAEKGTDAVPETETETKNEKETEKETKKEPEKENGKETKAAAGLRQMKPDEAGANSQCHERNDHTDADFSEGCSKEGEECQLYACQHNGNCCCKGFCCAYYTEPKKCVPENNDTLKSALEMEKLVQMEKEKREKKLTSGGK